MDDCAGDGGDCFTDAQHDTALEGEAPAEPFSRVIVRHAVPKQPSFLSPGTSLLVIIELSK
jgi:hypothetical protein